MGSVKDFVLKNFLILGLFFVLTAGLVFPYPGLVIQSYKYGWIGVPQIAVILIFIVSGMCLESVSDWWQPKALILGVGLILFVTPLVAIPIMVFGHGYVDQTLLQGMAVFCIVPTTLSSGVTMVTSAKGNVSLAVMLTSITNIVGVLIIPWTASMVFATTVPIDPLDMLKELIWLTLAPLSIGIVLQNNVAVVRDFAKRNKKVLGLIQNSCVLATVWLMTSMAQAKIMVTSPSDLTVCLIIAALIHLVYRVAGYVVATGFALEGREWVTVVLMCSQKSLPACVSVLSSLPAELRAQAGLLIVPCIMAHAAQLVIDSFLAVRWQQPDPEPKKEALNAALLPN